MHISTVVYALAAYATISHFLPVEAANLRSSGRRQLRNPLSSSCTVEVAIKLPIPDESMDTDEVSFECELDPTDTKGVSGISVPLKLDDEQKSDLQKKLETGELVSGESELMFDNGIMLSDIEVDIPPGQGLSISNDNVSTNDRRLAILSGEKPILVVKVTDVNGLARTESPAQIGDDIFGTLNDAVNLKSQMAACSMNELNIVPGEAPNAAAPGVIEVTIPISLTSSSQQEIRNAVAIAAQAKLEFSLPGPYQQVMYVLEKCYVGCGWAAYAYVNSWLSVYQGGYYKSAGVQMHGECLFEL